jgi:hypothetical protein
MALLSGRGVARLLLLSLGEPIAQDIIDAGLDTEQPWPGVTLERIPINDHGFRPVWAQRFVHEALDRGLERAINASHGVPAPANGSSEVDRRYSAAGA